MPGTWSKLVTVTTGQLITAAERNNEFDNVITNNTPDGCDDASANVAAMQATTNPGAVATESLATDLTGELKRLRYVLTAIHGGAQWYSSPATNALLKGGGTMSGNIDLNSVAYIKNWIATKYRRPVLQYASASVVNLEAGLTGTASQAAILFPDGDYRTDSTASRINCTMSQTAAFSGSAQSGIDTGSVSANTWYNFYAVKVTDSTTNFVVTASLLSPTQANYATLNSRFGTNGWVYLGTLCYGDNNAATTSIPTFKMVGNLISLTNANSGNGGIGYGLRMATTAGATTLTYTYAAGTALASAQTPSQLLIGSLLVIMGSATNYQLADAAATLNLLNSGTFTAHIQIVAVSNIALALGCKCTPNGSTSQDIFLTSYVDGVLGVGPNPFL